MEGGCDILMAIKFYLAAKASSVQASFCPFCGARYPEMDTRLVK